MAAAESDVVGVAGAAGLDRAEDGPLQGGLVALDEQEAVRFPAAGAIGLAAAALLDRGGYEFPGLLMAALTGLLISPISWDHRWVWVVPAVVLASHYAV